MESSDDCKSATYLDAIRLDSNEATQQLATVIHRPFIYPSSNWGATYVCSVVMLAMN